MNSLPGDGLLNRPYVKKRKLLRGVDREYLYNLEVDLEEKHNLEKHPEIVTRLRTKLSAWAGELDPPGLATGEMSRAATSYFDFYLDGTNVDLNTRTGLPPRLNEAPGNASEVFAWSLSGAPEGTQADPRYRLPRGNPKPTPYPASIQKTVE